jgi:hypothetical protein
MHLGVQLTANVFGRARCRDQRGIHYGTRLEQQPLVAQQRVDRLQYLAGKLMLLEQMPELQDRALVR